MTELDRFELARKVSASEWDGAVIAGGDEYAYDSVEDYLSDHFDPPPEPGSFVWAVKRRPLKLDAHGMVEHALEQCHEGVSDNITDSDYEELQRLVDGWFEKFGLEIISEDYSTAIVF